MPVSNLAFLWISSTSDARNNNHHHHHSFHVGYLLKHGLGSYFERVANNGWQCHQDLDSVCWVSPPVWNIPRLSLIPSYDPFYHVNIHSHIYWIYFDVLKIIRYTKHPSLNSTLAGSISTKGWKNFRSKRRKESSK